MLYKINEIGDEGLSLNLPLSADWLKTECPNLDATVGREGLRFKGNLSRQEDDVFLTGTLSGVLDCTCSRCLEPARLPLKLQIHVTFVEKDGASDDDEDEDEDDVDVAHYEGDEIDLAPELREEILLAMPINPLCKENCAGLCPHCGENRNLIPCDCASRQGSATTKLGAALQKLKM
jgi:uncharacterized protein